MQGIFNGKIKEYGVSETNAGNPQIFISFEVLDQETGNVLKTMSWFGSFVGGAKDITLKTLIACGLMPQNFGSLVNFKDGVASNMLDLNKVLSLDIQEEPKYDDPSKTVSKIQWVNDPNSAPQIKKVDEAKNAQFFGNGAFAQDLISLAGEMGLPLNNGQGAQMGNPGFNNNMNQNMNMNNNGQMNQGQQQMNMNQGQNMNANMNQGQQMNNNGQGQQQQQQQQQNVNNNGQQNTNANGDFQAPF